MHCMEIFTDSAPEMAAGRLAGPLTCTEMVSPAARLTVLNVSLQELPPFAIAHCMRVVIPFFMNQKPVVDPAGDAFQET